MWSEKATFNKTDVYEQVHLAICFSIILFCLVFRCLSTADSYFQCFIRLVKIDLLI